MKKRVKRYGGADDSFVLSDEARASGLRMGQNENIRDEDRQAALAQFRAQMSSEDSPYVRDVPQRQAAGLSDAQAAQLMGRQANTPAVQQRQMPNPAVPSPHDFPGPRNVQLPPQEFSGNQNYGTTPSSYLNARVNPYVQSAASDFLTRQDRAYQNSPRSPEMVNNPAQERLMRAIGEGSAETYRRNAVNESQMPNILKQQAQDELAEYRAQKGPYYEGKKAPTNQQLKERLNYFFGKMGSSSDEETPPKQEANPERVQRLIDSLKKKHKARNYKKGGVVKKAKPATSKASSRGDGIAQRGKTKGRMV